MWFVIGLFETLICAIAEDKVCDSCIVNSWALLIFLLCLWWPNSNFLCYGITQNGESSRDLLLSVTNRKLWLLGGTAPQTPPPPLQNIYYITTSHFLTTRPPQLVVGWGKRLVLWYLLTDGLKLLNCQIFSRLAFGIKGCSSKTRFISSIIRLLCPALWHYVCEHIIWSYIHCIFRLCASVCLRISVMHTQKKSALNRTFSTESHRNWQKSVKILKNKGLFLMNKQKF